MPPQKPKPLSRRSSKSEGGRRAKSETPPAPAKTGIIYPEREDTFNPTDAIVAEGPGVLQPSKLAYRDDARGLWLYHGDCLEVMDTLLAKHPAACST